MDGVEIFGTMAAEGAPWDAIFPEEVKKRWIEQMKKKLRVLSNEVNGDA